jgi:hypothetical protein
VVTPTGRQGRPSGAQAGGSLAGNDSSPASSTSSWGFSSGSVESGVLPLSGFGGCSWLSFGGRFIST